MALNHKEMKGIWISKYILLQVICIPITFTLFGKQTSTCKDRNTKIVFLQDKCVSLQVL